MPRSLGLELAVQSYFQPEITATYLSRQSNEVTRPVSQLGSKWGHPTDGQAAEKWVVRDVWESERVWPSPGVLSTPMAEERKTGFLQPPKLPCPSHQEETGKLLLVPSF